MPRLLIVNGSTRPGRVGAPVTAWLRDRVTADGRFAVDVADLVEDPLPFLDEPHHPRLGRYVHEHTRRWSARVAAADAFVFVTPEYNHGFSAPLKNAIDFLSAEWRDKPAGIVSYGGVSAGTRAAEMLKPVLAAVGIVPVADVPVPFVKEKVDEDGALRPNAAMDGGAAALLDALARWAALLDEGRKADGREQDIDAA